MTVDEAIKTAIRYETEVKHVYEKAVAEATDDVAKKVFGVLAREEEYHVDYLKRKMEEWTKTGTIAAEDMKAFFPKTDIASAAADLKIPVSDERRQAEVSNLQRALEVEIKTSDFYREMVSQLPAEGQELFRRFLEIEEGHVSIVQAELDAVSGHGYWFDLQEYSFEAG